MYGKNKFPSFSYFQPPISSPTVTNFLSVLSEITYTYIKILERLFFFTQMGAY